MKQTSRLYTNIHKAEIGIDEMYGKGWLVKCMISNGYDVLIVFECPLPPSNDDLGPR